MNILLAHQKKKWEKSWIIVTVLLLLAASCTAVAAPGTANASKLTSVPDGPKIRLNQPLSNPVRNPFYISIAFTASPDAFIALRSFQISVEKFIFGIPVPMPTTLVRNYIKTGVTERGIELSDIDPPAGTYRIKISIADSKGRRTTLQQTWTTVDE